MPGPDRGPTPRTAILVAGAVVALLAVLYGTASREVRSDRPVPPGVVVTTTTTVVTVPTTRPPTPMEQPAGVVKGIAGDGLDAVCAVVSC